MKNKQKVVNSMKIDELKSEPEEKLTFKSIKEMEQYFDQQIAVEKKKLGILYPLKLGTEWFIDFIKSLINNVIWIFQRIIRKHHTADIDLWNLDLYISKIFLPKLEAFRNQQLHVSPTADMETWLNILDEIIYSFRWNIYTSFESNPKKELNFYLKYFVEEDPNLKFNHEINSTLAIKANNRAQKGFELFGKYFDCLWD